MTELSKERKEKLEKNIWKYYLYRIFSSFTFTWPIFVLFLLDLGLNATQILTLQAFYTAVILVLQIPAGIAADYLGRKKVLIFNTVVFGIALVVYGLSTTFTHLLFAEFLFGICVATWIASGQPFLYDTLRELGKEGKFKKIYGNARAIECAAAAVGAILGGYLALHQLRTPFFASAIPVIVAVIIAFTVTDTKRYVHAEKKYFAHLKDALKFTATHPKVRFFIVYTMIISAVFFAASFFTQPYYQLAGLPLAYFGWIYAVMLTGSAIASKYAHEIEGYFGEKKLLVLFVLIPAVCYFVLSKHVLLLLIALPIIIEIVGRFYEIIIADYVNKHVESHHRSTVISLQATAGMMAMTVVSPAFGMISDAYNIHAVYLVSSVIMLVALALLLIIFYAAHRKTKKPSILA